MNTAVATRQKFTHPDLDGTFARLLGQAGFEYRDPNDGQSSDPADKKRFQYALLDGVLLQRVLPPAAVGNRWRDNATGKLSPHAPDWEAIPVPEHWGLLREWIEYSLGDDWPLPWSTGGYTAAAQNWGLKGLRLAWLRSRIEVVAGQMDWPQRIPCPHCWGWIVWAEAAYVPGYRICSRCHRHWQMSWPRQGQWVLRANGRKSWPY